MLSLPRRVFENYSKATLSIYCISFVVKEPSSDKCYNLKMAQWMRCATLNTEVQGSNPGEYLFFFFMFL